MILILVIVVTVMWVISTWVDIHSTEYDGTAVHLLFGSIVGGLIGLDQRAQRNGNSKNGNGS